MTSSKSKSATRKPDRARGSFLNRVATSVRAQKRLVVQDHGDAVAGQLDIELPRAGTGVQSEVTGLDRVFWSVERITPMRNDERLVRLRHEAGQKQIH